MWRTIFPEFVRGRGAIGLLLLRLAVGAAFVFHGWFKISSPGGMTGWMPPQAPVPGFLQAAAALSEFLGGIGLILGLLSPLAGFFLACTMIVAIGTVHLPAGHPFVSPGPGPSWELPAAYLAAALTVLLTGPGQLSLDYLLFGRLRSAERG
ncbi:MAG TPA: DoxX family protein [Gemmataceae bacterium]|nr:DoxX family protein [Gemmataceae bacterium]